MEASESSAAGVSAVHSAPGVSDIAVIASKAITVNRRREAIC